MEQQLLLVDIFRHVLNDPDFLQPEIVDISNDTEVIGFRTSETYVGGSYIPLPEGNKSLISVSCIHNASELLPKTHFRLGIPNSASVNGCNSLAASLLKATYPDIPLTIPNIDGFETFLSNCIIGNMQIDVTNNTASAKKRNKELATLFRSRKHNEDLITRLGNILYRNIIIINVMDKSIVFYPAHGDKSRYFNPFIHLVVLVQLKQCFEPILCSCVDKNKCELEIYAKILSGNACDITCIPEISMILPHGIYLMREKSKDGTRLLDHKAWKKVVELIQLKDDEESREFQTEFLLPQVKKCDLRGAKRKQMLMPKLG